MFVNAGSMPIKKKTLLRNLTFDVMQHLDSAPNVIFIPLKILPNFVSASYPDLGYNVYVGLYISI